MPVYAPADTTGMSVNPSQFDVLQHAVAASALRHKVIAQNIANVNTPGYQAREVRFEEALQRAVDSGGSEGLRGTEVDEFVDVREAAYSAVRQDGNTVDMDREIGNLNENVMKHQVYFQILATKFAQMRSAITGR
ncbi:MAG: flagellar basal body rod protein FlgB [Planctomycetales bacterium]|nr:flagellar basal body rod protein FlgB [Planctomycetales bacterium]